MNKRRKLVIALGAGALTTPFGSRAQQSAVLRRVGILVGGTASDSLSQAQLVALREGLQQQGWMEGRNLKIDNRWGEGSITVMRSEAEALVSGKPDVIAVSTATALREVQRAASKTLVLVQHRIVAEPSRRKALSFKPLPVRKGSVASTG